MVKLVGLRPARKAKGLSQVRLSALTRIKQGDLSAFENGHRSARIATLVKLADALGVSVDQLIGRPTPQRPRKGK
jgi:transcriptional regulator with XRE-family HTH domain